MSCNYCGAETTELLESCDVNRRVSNILFRLNRCNACNLISLSNPPADLGRYYTNDYHSRPTSVTALYPTLESQQYKLDIVKDYVRKGDLLEIGPSVGSFSLMAKYSGFNVSAIEMDQQCVDFLNAHVGVRAIQSSDPVTVLTAEARAYDVICLWQALEHIQSPWQVMDAAADHLKPGGALVIACPNPDAWQAKIMGARWPHWDLPRHLYSMPIPWILKVAERKGLVPKLVTTKDRGSAHLSVIGWCMFASNLATHPVVRYVLGRIGIEIGKWLRPWDGREGLGSCYTIVLEKR